MLDLLDLVELLHVGLELGDVLKFIDEFGVGFGQQYVLVGGLLYLLS